MVTLGLAYTVGSGWQIQGFDVGYGRGMRSGPIAALSLSARLGEFIDQRAIVGGSQGFVFGATLAARSRALTIAEFGADTAPLGLIDSGVVALHASPEQRRRLQRASAIHPCT